MKNTNILNTLGGCNKCNLCLNQPPLLQEISGHCDVMFVGLSAVQANDLFSDEPFAQTTQSGALLRDIVKELTDLQFYFTNIVKCLPLSDGKIRYPSHDEMGECFVNYKVEIAELLPSKVVLLGKQVSGFVSKQLGFRFSSAKSPFEFETIEHDGIEYMDAYHPSYVSVYKRKDLPLYKDAIESFVRSGGSMNALTKC